MGPVSLDHVERIIEDCSVCAHLHPELVVIEPWWRFFILEIAVQVMGDSFQIGIAALNRNVDDGLPPFPGVVV